MKIKSKRNVIILVLILVIILCGGIVWFASRALIKSIDVHNSSEAVLKSITENHREAVISVGIWQDGKEEKYIYSDGKKQNYREYIYQIGSITKTFTASMIAQEESKGLLNINDKVGTYIPLKKDSFNPVIKDLLTHHSGLTDQWENSLQENGNTAFSKEDIIKTLSAVNKPGKKNDFSYSNFGTGVAGTVAASCYGADKDNRPDMSYEEAMNDFLLNELELTNTKAGGMGDFEHNWEWKENDEIMAAGALTSTVSDLLSYGQKYLEGIKNKSSRYAYLKNCTKPLAQVDSDYDIGYFWIIDKDNGIIWHNGEVSMEGKNGNEEGYQTFIGISPKNNKVVTVMSNVIANDKDDTPYTDILGYLLLAEN